MALVGEKMTEGCQCVGEHDSVAAAARRLAEIDVGALPICGEDDRLKGMVTDRDIVVKIVAPGLDPAATEAGSLASGTPIWVEADASLERAMALMAEHKVRRLPVIEEKRLVGMISQSDIAEEVSKGESGGLVASISSAPANN